MDNLSRMLADIDELANDPNPEMRPTPYAVNLAKELLIGAAELMSKNLPRGEVMIDGSVLSKPKPTENEETNPR